MGDAHTLCMNMQEILEAEFCPPLDTSLLAALVAELDTITRPGDTSWNETLQNLRMTLCVLAQQAEKDDTLLPESFAEMNISSRSTTTDETGSAIDSSGYTTSSSVSSAPGATNMSNSSPLEFLQAAFPHLPAAKLVKVLDGLEYSDEIDMEAVVEGILSEEYVRELEERGLEDETMDTDTPDDWKVVNRKGKAMREDDGPYRAIPHKKKKGRVKAVPLVDIRQKQHARPVASVVNAPFGAGDPWTQLSSLAMHLATLLPPHPASFFQSMFHSPTYATPAIALRAALSSISKDSSASNQEIKLLFGLLEILRSSPDYEGLNTEDRARLMSDAQLALSATDSRSDEALDLVWLLKELDADFASAQLEMGVYHSPSPIIASPSPSSPSVKGNPASALFAPPSLVSISTPPISVPKLKPPPAPNPPLHDWQIVQPRAPRAMQIHPLAEYIPAYNPLNVPRKVRGSGNAIGKGGKGDVGEIGTRREADFEVYKSKLEEYRQKRSEALREASRYWQRGNSKSRGGEVAFYFAERAREIQEKSRKLALDAAREFVENKRFSNSDSEAHTIDLHGTSISEALVIVNEVLSEGWTGPGRPLRIITGRGSHSANRVGVLGPVIKRALEAEGWSVDKWDGGLIVRGNSTRSRSPFS